MTPTQIAAISAVFLFFGMLILTFVGHRIGRRRLQHGADSSEGSTGTVDAAVFALLGLLTAFTFSGAYTRLDARRQLIVKETNAIGTAYLRLDLLPGDAQPSLRQRFLDYIDSRAGYFLKSNDAAAANAEFERSKKIQGEIWSQVLAASAGPGLESTRRLILPALNDMIDITTTREVAARTHPPLLIYAMLYTLALACAVLAGHAMARSSTLSLMHVVGFAALIAATFYVILDMEHPRSGVIRLDASNALLLDLRHQLERSLTRPAGA